MNKFCLIFVLCTVFFSVSCDDPLKFENPLDENNKTPAGEGELGGECYPNKTCNEGLICEDESNSCIKNPESADTDITEPDDDSGEPVPPDLPECSPSNTGPCYDPASRLTWSKKADLTYNWNGAGKYCVGLSEGGYSDWRLPDISELRTLIMNCPGTAAGGECGVVETDESGDPATSCLSYNECMNDACKGCAFDENNPGQYSKFGDSGEFWSSSSRADLTSIAWVVYFDRGYVYNSDKSNNFYVQCVR